VIAAVIPLILALTLPQTDISLSVGLSFALAASTFCPVLVIGIWWRRLTWVGAAAGMIIGGGLVLVALVLNIISRYTGSWAPWPVIQPALITVPVAFAAVFLGSLATQSRVPDDVSRILLRLHAPDPLGFIRDRDVARFGGTSAPARPVDGRHHR
jgi:Na+(H+)/acetate symporter ActP